MIPKFGSLGLPALVCRHLFRTLVEDAGGSDGMYVASVAEGIEHDSVV